MAKPANFQLKMAENLRNIQNLIPCMRLNSQLKDHVYCYQCYTSLRLSRIEIAKTAILKWLKGYE